MYLHVDEKASLISELEQIPGLMPWVVQSLAAHMEYWYRGDLAKALRMVRLMRDEPMTYLAPEHFEPAPAALN